MFPGTKHEEKRIKKIFIEWKSWKDREIIRKTLFLIRQQINHVTNFKLFVLGTYIHKKKKKAKSKGE